MTIPRLCKPSYGITRCKKSQRLEQVVINSLKYCEIELEISAVNLGQQGLARQGLASNSIKKKTCVLLKIVFE